MQMILPSLPLMRTISVQNKEKILVVQRTTWLRILVVRKMFWLSGTDKLVNGFWLSGEILSCPYF